MELFLKLDLLKRFACAVRGLFTLLPRLSTLKPVLSFSSVSNENVECFVITDG